MLIELVDKLVGRVSKKWLIGRRMVVDLSESNERRVAVIELPAGSFSFDIRDLEGKSQIVLVSDAGTRVVATYSDPALAIKASQKIRFSITRPFKRVVWACIGILIVLFTFDVLTTPHAGRVASPGKPGSVSNSGGGSLSQEQIAALQRLRQPQSAPAPQPPGNLTDKSAVPSLPEAQSSPEALAAMRLLSGK